MSTAQVSSNSNTDVEDLSPGAPEITAQEPAPPVGTHPIEIPEAYVSNMSSVMKSLILRLMQAFYSARPEVVVNKSNNAILTSTIIDELQQNPQLKENNVTRKVFYNKFTTNRVNHVQNVLEENGEENRIIIDIVKYIYGKNPILEINGDDINMVWNYVYNRYGHITNKKDINQAELADPNLVNEIRQWWQEE